MSDGGEHKSLVKMDIWKNGRGMGYRSECQRTVQLAASRCGDITRSSVAIKSIEIQNADRKHQQSNSPS